MIIAAFLTDRIELVEEQDAGLRARVVEQRPEPRIRLTQVAAHKCIVSNNEKR